MSQYHKLYTPQDSAIVFIDHQPQMLFGVANADRDWTRRELSLAQSQFTEIFGQPARMHGAAGWQLNDAVPDLERDLGFQYASDTRGVWPFLPVVNGVVCSVPQIPTTLPTLDELLGRFPSTAALRDHMLALTEQRRDQVFTLHAELEGGALLGTFLELLRLWLDQGYELSSVATLYENLDLAHLPKHTILQGSVDGRSGTLAVQGPRVSS